MPDMIVLVKIILTEFVFRGSLPAMTDGDGGAATAPERLTAWLAETSQRVAAIKAGCGPQEWLARQLGVSGSYVSHLCSGRRKPTEALGKKIHKVTKGVVSFEPEKKTA